MADYQLTADPNLVRRARDGAAIPADTGNRDWQEYLRWKAAGNLADPVPAPPALRVRAVPPVALRKALRSLAAPEDAPEGTPNALAYILAALDQPGFEDAKDGFEYMVRAERADLSAMATPLGFTEADVDNLLAYAASVADPRDVEMEPVP